MAKTSRVRKLENEPRIEDFGGDAVKMALQKAVDTGRPATRVNFTLEPEIETAWRNRQFGVLNPGAIAVTLAKLYEAGEVRGSARKDGTVEITVSDPAVMERLAAMNHEFHDSRPVSRDEAMDVLKEGRGRLGHLRQHNGELDFGPATEVLNSAQATFNAHALKTGAEQLDYRPVVQEVESAVRTAEDIVVEALATGIRRMGAPDSEERLTQALATEGLRERRNAVLELLHLLLGMGYSDPEFVSKRQQETDRRSTSGRPHRNRDDRPGRFQQRRVRF